MIIFINIDKIIFINTTVINRRICYSHNISVNTTRVFSNSVPNSADIWTKCILYCTYIVLGTRGLQHFLPGAAASAQKENFQNICYRGFSPPLLLTMTLPLGSFLCVSPNNIDMSSNMWDCVLPSPTNVLTLGSFSSFPTHSSLYITEVSRAMTLTLGFLFLS